VLRTELVDTAIRAIPESSSSNDLVDHLKRFSRSSGMPAPARYQDSLATMPWPLRRQLYVPELARTLDPAVSDAVVTDTFAGPTHGTNIDRALRTDLQLYLVDDILTLTDRLSMWHSLELRVPYLDHHFASLVMSVPDSFKLRRLTKKYLLKKVAERWLPRDMIYHKKQGFEAPMGKWLQGPLLPLFDSVVNRKTVGDLGLLQFDEVWRLRSEHVERRKKHSKILFAIFMLHAWHQRRASRRAPIVRRSE
jgi:asparagine synthase (glutamine-hydrolysing)